jgi:hypothetical protein
MRSALSKTLIPALLACVTAALQPSAEAQTVQRSPSAFIAAYRDWVDEQAREFRMRPLPQAQALAIVRYAERGECAVVNGFLFAVGWHHIPDHERYTDEDAVRYGRSIDALVQICEATRRERNLRADLSRGN